VYQVYHNCLIPRGYTSLIPQKSKIGYAGRDSSCVSDAVPPCAPRSKVPCTSGRSTCSTRFAEQSYMHHQSTDPTQHRPRRDNVLVLSILHPIRHRNAGSCPLQDPIGDTNQKTSPPKRSEDCCQPSTSWLIRRWTIRCPFTPIRVSRL